MSLNPSLVLLNRLLSGKELAPLTLIIDSLAQSGNPLLAEFAFKSQKHITFLSYETVKKPEYATHFLDCTSLLPAEVLEQTLGYHTKDTLSGSVKPLLDPSSSQKCLVIIDTLNYIPADSLAQFLAGVALQNTCVLAIYHRNSPVPHSDGYPSSLALLRYISQAILEVEPVATPGATADRIDEYIDRLAFPVGQNWNQARFMLRLTSRKKSGKSLYHNFVIDTATHHYEVYKEEKSAPDADEEEMLKGLTTFNLQTSSKQKLAREQVELPFMDAQTELGKFGGAIVYEFEKDDDYDEEDPYEDPF